MTPTAILTELATLDARIAARRRRRLEVTIKVSADSREAAAEAIRELADTVGSAGIRGCGMLGVGASGSYEVDTDESVTAESYRESLDQWVADRERRDELNQQLADLDVGALRDRGDPAFDAKIEELFPCPDIPATLAEPAT